MQNPGKPRSGRWDEDQAPKTETEGQAGTSEDKGAGLGQEDGVGGLGCEGNGPGQAVREACSRCVPQKYMIRVCRGKRAGIQPHPLGGPSLGSSAIKG